MKFRNHSTQFTVEINGDVKYMEASRILNTFGTNASLLSHSHDNLENKTYLTIMVKGESFEEIDSNEEDTVAKIYELWEK